MSITRYSAVFGRAPAVVRDADDRSLVSAYMFPPLKRSFWRSLLAEAHDQTVYVTDGLSLGRCRAELIAFTEAQIVGGPDGTDDVPTAVLQFVASYILEKDIPIGVGHTLDLQEPLTSNTEMSAVLFAMPNGIDEKRVCKCTDARVLLNVVLITDAEVKLARDQGVPALLDVFQAAGVLPVFDHRRRSAV